jgi:hypothetical protein
LQGPAGSIYVNRPTLLRVFNGVENNNAKGAIHDSQYGLPLATYSDRQGILHINLPNVSEDTETQFGRAAWELIQFKIKCLLIGV